MMRVRTFAPDAGGLKSGAPVRLAGIDVGSVRDVKISGLPESSQAVEIDMEVARMAPMPHGSQSPTRFGKAEALVTRRTVRLAGARSLQKPQF